MIKKGLPENEEISDLGEFLASLRASSGFSLQDFSRHFHIPIHHLTYLESNRFDKLPPDPFVVGMLRVYARAFGQDENRLREVFSRQRPSQTSGTTDLLPQNRFAGNVVFTSRRWQPAILVILFGLGYLGFATRSFLLPPKIILSLPPEPLAVRQNSFLLEGRVLGAREFFINDKVVKLDRGGTFSEVLALLPGPNTIEGVATNYLGRKAKATRYLIYEEVRIVPGASPLPTPTVSPAPVTPSPLLQN